MGGNNSDPTSLAAPVNYSGDTTLGNNIGVTIAIIDTQIMITNLVSGFPFCVANTVGTAAIGLKRESAYKVRYAALKALVIRLNGSYQRNFE